MQKSSVNFSLEHLQNATETDVLEDGTFKVKRRKNSGLDDYECESKKINIRVSSVA